MELRFDLSTEDERIGPPRASDAKPQIGRCELQVFQSSQAVVEHERALAVEHLATLEAEFAKFRATDNPDMSREEYNMLDRSFQNRIAREKEHWDHLDASSIPIRTFPLQTGDYLVAGVASSGERAFKVANTRKEMVFRADSKAERDDWISRFSLGQLKQRIMAHTGTLATHNEARDWPRDPSVDPREKESFHVKHRVVDPAFDLIMNAHAPMAEEEEEEEETDVVEDDYVSPVRAASPMAVLGPGAAGALESGREQAGADTFARVGSASSHGGQKATDADAELPSDFTVDLFWQRRSLFAVPAQLWLNPAYDGLCGLYLDRNSITHLPEECAKFTSLLALSISDNQLKDIPEWIGSLPRLRTLAAPRNQISCLPHALGKLKTLENLNVFGNQIERLPIQLGNCEMLVEFNVRNNPLVALDSEEESGFTLDLAVPVASLDLIRQGHNEKAIRQLLPFWQRRLEEYEAEMNRLEETREDRERAVMLAQQVLEPMSRFFEHNEFGWFDALLQLQECFHRIALQLLPLLTSRDRRRSVLAGNAICSLWIPSHARFHCLADLLCLVLLSAAVRPPC